MKKYLSSVIILFGKLFAIGCLGTITFAACMRIPVSQNDYSAMRNDFFSDLIREGEYDRGDPTLSRNYGVGMIDPQKIKKKSNDFFLGKTSTEVMNTFSQEQGYCESLTHMHILTCNVVRSWNLKTVGRGEPTIRKTMKPKAMLLYRFALSESDNIIGIEVEVKDFTKFYPHK